LWEWEQRQRNINAIAKEKEARNNMINQQFKAKISI